MQQGSCLYKRHGNIGEMRGAACGRLEEEKNPVLLSAS
jgi:hypothetical protein